MRTIKYKRICMFAIVILLFITSLVIYFGVYENSKEVYDGVLVKNQVVYERLNL